MELITERLKITPMTADELQDLSDLFKEASPELSQAYLEMLSELVAHPEDALWYTSWKITKLSDSAFVGDVGFKGLNREKGTCEVGYGLTEKCQGQGYATEAVKAMILWAMSFKEVKQVEAETEPDNVKSQNVLKKLGFTPTGVMGKEGPRFVLLKQ